MLANRIGLLLAVLGAAVIMTAACLVHLVDGGWILVASSIAVGASALWVSRGNHRDAVLPVAVCFVTSVPVLAGAGLQRVAATPRACRSGTGDRDRRISPTGPPPRWHVRSIDRNANAIGVPLHLHRR